MDQYVQLQKVHACVIDCMTCFLFLRATASSSQISDLYILHFKTCMGICNEYPDHWPATCSKSEGGGVRWGPDPGTHRPCVFSRLLLPQRPNGDQCPPIPGGKVGDSDHDSGKQKKKVRQSPKQLSKTDTPVAEPMKRKMNANAAQHRSGSCLAL